MLGVAAREIPGATPASKVVCVDLDGTLIAGDLLWESFVALATRRPFRAIALLWSLKDGKAAFKRRLSQERPVDPATLPYRPEVVEHLRDLDRAGAYLVLATGSDRLHAEAVANHLGVFSELMASDGTQNLTGAGKAAALVNRFGRGGFSYVGNDWADVPVWDEASDTTVVAGSKALVRFLRGRRPDTRVVAPSTLAVKPLIRALRPHQWAKNALVFVPILAGHTLFDPTHLLAAALTFVAFSLCASSIYIVNDILDIEADRLHPRKRTRPFASGELTIPHGWAAAGALIVAATALTAATLPPAVLIVGGAYVVTTCAYSFRLKRAPVVDVFTLTALYVLRIVAGGVATGTVLSSWLLAFGLFFFLSLAFVKRYSELMVLNGRMPGRDYTAEDGPWMHAVGTSAGYMAVVVLALYVTAPEVTSLYSNPRVLWLLCPLILFWLTRLWFRAGRRLVHDDPVLEAIKDPFSYAVLALAAAAILAGI